MSAIPCGGCGAAGCRACQLYADDPRYRRLWGGAAPAARAECRRRGPEAGRELCPTCAGKVEVKVFGCGLHGRCQAAAKIPGVRDCASCPDWEAAGAPAPGGPGP